MFVCFWVDWKEAEKRTPGARTSCGGKGGGGQPPTHSHTHAHAHLLGSSALADALLGGRDLGPQHRHAPEVARERRDPLAPLAVDGEEREPVDAEGLDGGAHLGRGLAVDGHEVDVRIVRRELPELGGQGAARGAGRDTVRREEEEEGEARSLPSLLLDGGNVPATAASRSATVLADLTLGGEGRSYLVFRFGGGRETEREREKKKRGERERRKTKAERV